MTHARRPGRARGGAAHRAGPDARTRTAAVLAAAGLAALLAAGCGAGPASPDAATAGRFPRLSLATFAAGPGGAGWAVVQLGRSAAQHENFWELFTRPAGTARWLLATPTGVAANGGIAVAGTARRSAVAGFQPSQRLTFSPLAVTADGGKRWSQASPLQPGLADLPDALAAGPGGRVLALTQDGGVEWRTGTGAGWTVLTSLTGIARSAAGRACGLTSLTATAFGPGGQPLLGGTCSRPGIGAIFTPSHGGWALAGPRLAGAQADRAVTVTALAAADGRILALLQVGTGARASVVAAWTVAGGPWHSSAQLPLHGAQLESVAIGPGGAIGLVLNHGRAAELTRPGAAWRSLPALPAWTATLAPGPGGGVDALTAHLASFGVWRLAPGADRWRRRQVVHITIPYGSSG